MSIGTNTGVTQATIVSDDASGKILAAGEFGSANIENGIRMRDKAVRVAEFYRPIRTLLSDHKKIQTKKRKNGREDISLRSCMRSLAVSARDMRLQAVRRLQRLP